MKALIFYLCRVRTAADMEDGILKRRHFHIQYKNKTATTSKTILRKILSRLENVVVIELDGAGCTQFSRAMASSMESRELESLVAAEMKRYNNGRVLKLNVSAASSDNLYENYFYSRNFKIKETIKVLTIFISGLRMKLNCC